MYEDKAFDSDVMVPRVLGGGLAGAQAATRAVPAMEIALKTLAERIGRLEQTAANLEARFSSVLRPEPPAAQELRKEGRQRATSQIGSAIETFSAQIDAVSDRLGSLLVRCELEKQKGPALERGPCTATKGTDRMVARNPYEFDGDPDGCACAECGEDAVIELLMQGSFFEVPLCGACADQLTECPGCEQLIWQRNGTRIYSSPNLYCPRCTSDTEAALARVRVSQIDQVRR
jgi:hypothetical protein